MLLTLTACGSSESLASGSEKDSSSAQSSGTDEATEDTGGELTESNFLSTIAQAQLDASTAQLDMSIELAGQSITMTGQLEAAETVEDSAMEAQMEIPGQGAISMILVDSTLYMSLGEATGGKYFELSLDDPSVEQFLGQLKNQMNPAQAVKALEGAVTGFEAAGSETIDGEETTKYVLEVDAQKVFASQGTMLPPGVDVPKSLTYTFWVNDENLPLRMAVDMGDLGQAEMNFSAWGEPVDIEAPPPSQITDENPLAPAA
jgi:hypothetical protein